MRRRLVQAEFATLVEALRFRATDQPDRIAVTFLADGEDDEVSWTYRQLEARARAIAAKLRGLGASGGRALVLHPPGLELIAALFGCFEAGVAAVPTYPPSFNLRSRSADRFSRLVQDDRPALALTDEANAARGAWFSWKEAGPTGLRWVATDRATASDDAEPAGPAPAIGPDTLAVIQYTSGSTRAPRGVMLSHRNLQSNLKAIRDGFGLGDDDVIASWLPPYHDMGLIGNILGPIAWGIPLVLMTPQHVLEKPVRWLRAISRHRATGSGGPNFAYDLCVRGIPPKERDGLDLGCWQIAFSGAERVRAETLGRFSEAFGPCGFRPEAFYPCYGLAEATLFVAGDRERRAPVVRSFHRDRLTRGEATPARGPEATTLVGCGRAQTGHRIVVVDSASACPCPEGQVGEIWVAGPSVALGYWEKPEESAGVFQNRLSDDDRRYLRTGDLGFVRDGDLFVTGRLKDLIIVRGRNFSPQDIEEVAEFSHPALALSGSVAFGVDEEGEERVVVASEVRREHRRGVDAPTVLRAVREAVAAETGLRLHAVLLLKPHELPRTTSGKIRHRACRAAYLERAWEPIAEDRAPTADEPRSTPVAAPDLDALRSARGEARRPLLEHYLRARLATLLKTPEHWVDADKPLGHLGVDSLLGVELVAQVEADLEITLPAGTLASGLTAAQLVDRLMEEGPRPAGGDGRPIDYAVPGRAVPLTPIQAKFLRPGADHPEKFSTVLILRTPAGTDARRLEEAIRSVADAHDAFRLRFHRVGDGWRQEYVWAGSAVAFRQVDASTFGNQEVARLHRMLYDDRPGAFDLTLGPLVVADWIDRGRGESGILQLCLHHLVCDGLSVSIVVADLQRAYHRLDQGELPDLRDRGTSFGAWATALDALAQADAIRGELGSWQEMTRDLPQPWRDPFVGAANAVPRPAPRAEFGPAEQRRFLERFPTARDQHQAMLAALARAWEVVTGQPNLFVQLEGHGRHPVDGLDPSGIVGWLVVEHPFRVRTAGHDDASLVRHIRDALDALPRDGLGHGLLTYSCRDPAVRRAMASLPTPRIAMFYYAHLHNSYREDGLFPVLHEYSYHEARPVDDLQFDLIVTAGQDRGTTWWNISGSLERFGPETFARLSDEVRAFLTD
jgi:acyl-CoA synthetase (AMP-forming)/AMP-acid ligase II